MRCDIPVFFRRNIQGEYDSDTGNYGPDIVVETKKRAGVTDAGADTLNLVYGEIRQGVKVVKLQRHYNDPFDRIRIGRKTYRVDMERKLRAKHIFVVSEVQ